MSSIEQVSFERGRGADPTARVSRVDAPRDALPPEIARTTVAVLRDEPVTPPAFADALATSLRNGRRHRPTVPRR